MRNATDILPVAMAMMQNGCEIQLILMRRATRIKETENSIQVRVRMPGALFRSPPTGASRAPIFGIFEKESE